MNSSSVNSNNQNLGKNCKDYLVNFWTRVPIFVRSVIITTFLLYILSLYTNDVQIYLGNTPQDTVNHLRIWTLFTSCMVNPNIINLIFAYISWIPDGIRLESSNGTVKYILNFFINNSVIQFTFIVVTYILSFIDTSIVNENSLGLWPAIMAEITMLCIASPENYVTLCFIPFEFRAKFYPFAIYLFLIVANGFKFFIIDVLISIGFGYLYFFHIKNFLNVGDNLVMRTEKAFSFLTKFTGNFLLILGFVAFQNNLNLGSFGYIANKAGNDHLNTSSASENYQDGSLIVNEINNEKNSTRIEIKDNNSRKHKDKNSDNKGLTEEDHDNEKKQIPGESLDE